MDQQDLIGYITARRLAELMQCSIRTANKLIADLPPNYRRRSGNKQLGYLPMIRIPYSRPGNPLFRDTAFQSKMARRKHKST